jgi:2'-5' RNA ligase
MFIAIPVPSQIVPAISLAFEEYPQHIEKILPTEKWHLTLLWLGDVENPKQYYSRLTKPMPQSFVPTVRYTHVGRGAQRQQLWAYAEPSPSLLSMREALVARLRTMRFPFPEKPQYEKFIPHTRVANLYSMSGGVGLADFPLTTTFVPKEIHIIRSELTPTGSEYFIENRIPLTESVA